MMEEAITMCPENPMGYLTLGLVYERDYMLGNTKAPRETIEKGIELTQKALAMDGSIARGPGLLCLLYMLTENMTSRLLRGNGLWPSTPVGHLNFPIMPIP